MTSRLWASVAALAVATLMTATFAIAGSANPNRGKTLFRSTCKTCHVSKGEAKDLTPLTKTQAQWQRAFKADVPKMLPRVAQKTGKTLTPADLADMEFFLVSHAADSDQPETCGVK
jgi:cytochrome c5